MILLVSLHMSKKRSVRRNRQSNSAQKKGKYVPITVLLIWESMDTMCVKDVEYYDQGAMILFLAPLWCMKLFHTASSIQILAMISPSRICL